MKQRHKKNALLDVARDFDRLAREIRRERRRWEAADRRTPSTGAWYFIFLRPRWILLAFRSEGHGETGHSTLWEMNVVKMISEHYGIDPDKVLGIDCVRNAYAGMPRGRVTLKGRKWIFYHGGDTPVDWGKARKMLLDRFGLAREAHGGRVEFVFDEHEQMIREDQRTLTLALGSIPYKRSPRRGD